MHFATWLPVVVEAAGSAEPAFRQPLPPQLAVLASEPLPPSAAARALPLAAVSGELLAELAVADGGPPVGEAEPLAVVAVVVAAIALLVLVPAVRVEAAFFAGLRDEYH